MDTNTDLADALGVVMMLELDGATVPPLDAACFAAAIAANNPEVRGDAAEVAADPMAWYQIAAESRLLIMTAFVDCAGIGAVVNMLALDTINATEAGPCIAKAWSGVLTTDAIASSMSFLGGLDDLPPDVVSRLVTGVMFCMPAEQGWTNWWIDDIRLEIERRHDVTSEQANCVATNFVRRLGVERAVERRVLTIPVLALSDADLTAIDLAGCGASITLPPLIPGVVGDCLAAAEGDALRVACDAPHEYEVIHLADITEIMPSWPGQAALSEHGSTACQAVAEAAIAGRDLTLHLYWWPPTRVAWERGSRVITCVVGPADNGVWTAPFALVPASTTTTTTAAPPSTVLQTAPVPAPAPTQQPTGLGTDAAMDLYAIACFNGTMQACDNLYDQSALGSAYETFGDTCAGRQPAGTGRYCTDVFTDTVAQHSSPTITPSTTSVVTSTTTAAPAPVPPTDPDLGSRIPVVDGYTIAEMRADDVLWNLFDSSLPGGFTRHHALVVAADGIPVAHLVVAATTGNRPAIDTFVEDTFADYVFLPARSVEIPRSDRYDKEER